jgi:hypothetical protein
VVESVEHLRAEFQPALFIDQRKELLEAQVPVVYAGTIDHVPPGVAEIPDRRNGETLGIKRQKSVGAQVVQQVAVIVEIVPGGPTACLCLFLR